MEPQEQKKFRQLTKKQEAFCRHYVVNDNQTQSAILAGYSKKSASAIATEMLKVPSVINFIAELKKDIKKNEPVITTEYVLHGLKEVAERCLQRKPVMRFDWSEKALVQETTEDGEGIWTFDAQGANKAFELLGRHLGIFERDNSLDQPLIKVEITKNTVIINNNDGTSSSTTEEETQTGYNDSNTGRSLYTMLPPITE